jgi:hypothetical protein
MSAVKDQVLVVWGAMEVGKGVEAPGRIVARLKGEVLLSGELVSVEER